MTEYDDELQQGMELAVGAAAASRELDEQVRRWGAGRPVPPGTPPVGDDPGYRAVWDREIQASQAFWSWVKQHARFVTDHDLGAVLRVLAGQESDPS